MFTTVHKHYTVEDWKSFAAESQASLKVRFTITHTHTHTHTHTGQYMAISCGSGEEDLKKLELITSAVPDLQYICLDVANGYSEHFVDCVRKTREAYPNHTLMVRDI